MLFDLSDYRLRKLDPAQGTKPLDFGGGGITGSINLDGRFIAINTYHPEHGYITLTSIPPFPDEDRYDQAKVRAYRKSLVTNDGFGLEFEQEIVEREYYLIEDAVPFIRFTLADGSVAECVTHGKHFAQQEWKFSRDNIKASYTGKIWLMRTSYSQLTEGGVLKMPATTTSINPLSSNAELVLCNQVLGSYAHLTHIEDATESPEGAIQISATLKHQDFTQTVFISNHAPKLSTTITPIELQESLHNLIEPESHLMVRRASVYANICALKANEHGIALLTDHMILPLSWNRDAYYTSVVFPDRLLQSSYYLAWLFNEMWRGTYCRRKQLPIPQAWGRSYLANGQQKDSRAFQLDQQIFPILAFADVHDMANDSDGKKQLREHYHDEITGIFEVLSRAKNFGLGLYVTDETPADDDIPMSYHFSSHILLWYALKRLQQIFLTNENNLDYYLQSIKQLEENIPKYFITEHKGKKIYSYATDGEDNHYIYHDANDIPLVMMPLWGFCEKDDEIWLNTIEFAFSDANPGFYDGVLGSVHTPAPWALGDAQELIYCKVVGDRERYQRVWERVEKAAQWDGALPEAYDPVTFEVVSRHWFAWPNAMVAIADGISWNWETEGEYAR